MNNQSEGIAGLKAIAADTTLKPAERQEAAEHAIALMLATLPVVDDTDPEVAKLMQPWPRGNERDAWLADCWAVTTNGRSLNGYSLADARTAVSLQHKRSLLRSMAYAADTSIVLRAAALSAWKGLTPFV